MQDGSVSGRTALLEVISLTQTSLMLYAAWVKPQYGYINNFED